MSYMNRHPDYALWAERAFESLRLRMQAAGKPIPVELELFQADVRSHRMSHDETADVTSGEDDQGMKEWIAIDDAAGLADVSRRTIHRWLDDGLLASEKRGRRRLISRPSLLSHIGGDDA